VYYRSSLLAAWQTYTLQQVAEVRPKCTRSSRGGWDVGLDLVTTDGTVLELGAVEPLFTSSANRILPLLRGLAVNPAGMAADCPASWRQIVQLQAEAGGGRV
jgi:hypothetical protein